MLRRAKVKRVGKVVSDIEHGRQIAAHRISTLIQRNAHMSGARIVTLTRFMHRRQKNMSGMGVNNRNVLSGTFGEIICITRKACICRMRPQFSQVMLTGRSANMACSRVQTGPRYGR
jgi:hypothetical protein